MSYFPVDRTVIPSFEALVEEYCTVMDKLKWCFDFGSGVGKHHPYSGSQMKDYNFPYADITAIRQIDAEVIKLNMRNNDIKKDIELTMNTFRLPFDYDHEVKIYLSPSNTAKTIKYSFSIIDGHLDIRLT